MKSRLRNHPFLKVAFLLAAFAVAPHGHALEQGGAAGPVRFTVYAPDWTWQKQAVNILFVLEHDRPDPLDAVVELEFPPGKESHFKVAGGELRRVQREGIERFVMSLPVTVPPGRAARTALTNIQALDGVPRQVYDFALTVRCGGEESRLPYPLRTIRGAAVSSAKWALYVPVVVALAWSVFFAAALARYASRGAWRMPNAPVPAPQERESWIDQAPS